MAGIVYTVVTLDKRHNGYGVFKYAVDFNKPVKTKDSITKITSRIDNFQAHRSWCWETWGPGMELEFSSPRGVYPSNVTGANEWCWDTSEGSYKNALKLYLKGDAELMLYKLKWA